MFTDVEPDPDAVLEAAGIDSPDDLLEAGGAHDPDDDEVIDAVDADLEALAAELESVEVDAERLERTGAESTRSSGEADASPPEEGRPTDGPARDALDATAVLVGAPTVTIRSDDEAIAHPPSASATSGRPGDEPANDRAGDGSAERRADGEPTLVGPDPVPDRVPDDAFGGVEANTAPGTETEFLWSGGELETAR
ncbi:hypothetical protein EA472_09930 [Natrarchaeobius oligotrophus]|uniref:Uncharacterized protein n=1 Tax=Natrarchaeobius chitinivorans TaxID=1679083 RepID=A0A3N6PIX5_NATCH|nr:hypothetical protein EA472_09930 [Natrarchaeobius chitinivorans]